MLKVLRKKGVAKKILIGLAIIIIPAFVLWGSSSLVRDNKESNYAGVMFGKKISLDRYRSSWLACKNQAMMLYGDNFHKMQGFLDLNSEAWNRLILLHEVKRRKIKVADSEVIQRISRYSFFQKDGKFDNKTYQRLLEYVFRISARKFEEEIREVILLENLFKQITKSVSVEEDEILAKYKEKNEKVMVSFISLTADMFIEKMVISDEEINKHFQENKEKFRNPPTVNIQYFGLEYPQDTKEESDENEKIDKSIITNKMNEIALKIKKVKDFEKVSKAENLPIKETGHFTFKGPVPEIGWSDQFIQVAFDLNANQISNTIETAKGCYILKLKEQKHSYIPDIKELTNEIRNALKQKKAKEFAKNKAEEYLKAILEIFRSKQDVNFDKLAKQWNAKNDKTSLFARKDYIPNIGTSETFKEKAFSLKDKEEPFDVTSTEKGTFIIKLEEYTPIDKDKFSEERKDFEINVLKSKKNEYFNSFFEDLKKKAKLLNNIKLRPSSDS